MAYSRTPLIRINWDGEPSGYVEIRITGFFFQNTPHWQCEGEKVSKNCYFMLHIYLFRNNTLFGRWRSTGITEKTLGIPCLIREPLQLSLFTVRTCV